ncbi:MAG TPA: YifB family Mg chelatase-like AAA ATPase [Actinomycetes bacterium]|nr:YifB family Mg chelatase-like AAA ATPase [Actinomycetes bacterium]
MSLARTNTVTLTGVQGQVVTVEVDAAAGVPGFTLVGLADTAISEARDRVRAAIVNVDETWENRKVTINLSPAWVRKRGSGFDLALACACLAAFSKLPLEPLSQLVLIGELGLDGSARPVRGILPMVLAAVEQGFERFMVAEGSGREAALVPGADVTVVASLAEAIRVLRGSELGRTASCESIDSEQCTGPDLSDVSGQATPRLAVEVAAAGGHHVFLHGAPGAGKTLLAERLPGLLPPLDAEASLEVTAVHSVAGALDPQSPMVVRPPFQAPHHTATPAALVGGGAGVARPGAASLAHRGVLFLDEAPEFSVRALETLRQPMEKGAVFLARSESRVRYPARFLLVMAANPCPCGRSTGRGLDCTCTPMQKMRYSARLSGPLMDRIDLQVPVLPVSRADLLEGRGGESSADVRERVLAARLRAAGRLATTPWKVNADVPGTELRARFAARRDGMALVSTELGRGRLSARGVDRVLRVAWTLADLAEVDRPGAAEVAAAVSLRGGGLSWVA